jgi:hypothetical protein
MAFPMLTTRLGRIRKQDIFECGNGFYDELHFNRMFNLERKRAQRTGKPFILVLVHITGLKNFYLLDCVKNLQKALLSGFRDTDIRGWYRRESVMGIVFTELCSVGYDTRAVLFGKLLDALASRIDSDELKGIYITFHTYPATHEEAVSCGRFDLCNYPAPKHQIARAHFLPRMRNLMKATGPLAALLKFLPIFFSHPVSKT